MIRKLQSRPADNVGTKFTDFRLTINSLIEEVESLKKQINKPVETEEKPSNMITCKCNVSLNLSCRKESCTHYRASDYLTNEQPIFTNAEIHAIIESMKTQKFMKGYIERIEEKLNRLKV